MNRFQKAVSILLLFGLVFSLAACSKKPGPAEPTTPTVPTVPSTAPTAPIQIPNNAYYAAEDAPFLPKDVFSKAQYVPGITLGQSGDYVMEVTDNTNTGAFVFQGEFGKCYEIKIPAGVPYAAAARFPVDPRGYSVGKKLTYDSGASLKKIATQPSSPVSFMYTCRVVGEYLVIFTGNSNAIYIGERTIIQDADTPGAWYIPNPVGGVIDDKKLGDLGWTSEEVVDNMYEPVRAKYPESIARESIGTDQSGKYNMYCYAYTPKDYKVTVFLASGVHGDEGVGYFALAKCMQLIADAQPGDEPLYTLRQKVRFVVIPIVNVWSVSTVHTRENSTGKDLNRDFDKLTQQETKNTMACFAKYANEVSVFFDFHIAGLSDVALYFNFINYADNAVANYKTTNHMYHRYMELGYTDKFTDLTKVPGSYAKGSQYFEGRIWNKYKIPTITVEYVTTPSSSFPKVFTDKCMTLAVETYMNFIIQNSLFYIQNK